MMIQIPKQVSEMLDEFDVATFDVEHHERLMKRAAKRRAELVREMLKHVSIETLSAVTGLRIIRLRDLEEKR